MKLPVSRLTLFLVLVLVATLGWMGWHRYRLPPGDDGALLLLLPDGMNRGAAPARLWFDAASEEGVSLRPITASQLLELPADADSGRGMIVPDQLLREAPQALVARVRRFAAAGQLMLVYDALSAEAGSTRESGSAPLADLVGVRYARYRELGGAAIASGSILMSPATEKLLLLPPGKTMPVTNAVVATRLGNDVRAISGYQYGVLTYPSFRTAGTPTGEVLLLTSTGDLAAGYRRADGGGGGGVLFVNLPLGDLKGRTDGLLLHTFLHYFAVTLMHQPTLSAAPDGVGGLVFNWHVDSNAATAVLRDIDSYPFKDQGPFSIHVTAGPDMQRAGDRAGLDLDHNQVVRDAVRRFAARGDAIGSHGGWIHNYFGQRIGDEESSEFTDLLERNIASVARASGRPVLEYSAPLGNQPEWVTRWLDRHGFVAYYFTGDTGMSPTRSYRNGQREAPHIWAFPIMVYGDIASFDEALEAEVPEDVMTEWLRELSTYVADNGTIKTFYSHPHIFPRYRTTLADWMSTTLELQKQGRFRWHTMTDIAQFLDRRDNVQWSVTRTANGVVVRANSSEGLAHFAWNFPRDAYAEPAIDSGQAEVNATTTGWRVTGKGGQSLVIAARRATP